jgi:hypothetical protein
MNREERRKHYNLTGEDLDKFGANKFKDGYNLGKNEGINRTVEGYTIAVIYTAMVKLGYTDEECTDFMDKVDDTFKDISSGKMSYSDVVKLLETDYGITFGKEKEE